VPVPPHCAPQNAFNTSTAYVGRRFTAPSLAYAMQWITCDVDVAPTAVV